MMISMWFCKKCNKTLFFPELILKFLPSHSFILVTKILFRVKAAANTAFSHLLFSHWNLMHNVFAAEQKCTHAECEQNRFPDSLQIWN